VISTTCDSGFYDMETYTSCDTTTNDPCFAEWIIRADRRGAVTVIASPRESLIYVNGHLNEGYANAITYYGTGKTMRLADMFWYGQGWITGSCDPGDARVHTHLYHIFGDPSLRIRMQKPNITLVPHDFEVSLAALGHLTVHSSTEGATVTAFRNLDGNLVPVGRGVIKNGESALQMLTTREAATLDDGANLQVVVSHPDALPIQIPLQLPLPQYTLTLTPTQNGAVSADHTDGVYTKGQTATLTAVPARTYFTQWPANVTVVPNSPNTATILMDADKTVSVTFHLG